MRTEKRERERESAQCCRATHLLHFLHVDEVLILLRANLAADGDVARLVRQTLVRVIEHDLDEGGHGRAGCAFVQQRLAALRAHVLVVVAEHEADRVKKIRLARAVATHWGRRRSGSERERADRSGSARAKTARSGRVNLRYAPTMFDRGPSSTFVLRYVLKPFRLISLMCMATSGLGDGDRYP